jgi:predicted nucleotidyltransferase component of viral defense system
MIEQKKISQISNKTQKAGGKKVPESVIERDYCLSWFLFGLAQLEFKDKIIFKGGTALRRCHYEDYRFSEDLDFSLIKEFPQDLILSEFSKIFVWVKDESGMIFEHVRQDPQSENTYTFYISYVGPLPGAAKEVKVDVTFKENILTPVVEKEIIKTYDEYTDFLSDAKVWVYSLEEVAIEKTCALFSANRNEPRDLYDLYSLITEKGLDISSMRSEIEQKMMFKGASFEQRQGEFDKKEPRLKKTWETRLSKQMTSLPAFDEVFREVKRAFRKAKLLKSE